MPRTHCATLIAVDPEHERRSAMIKLLIHRCKTGAVRPPLLWGILLVLCVGGIICLAGAERDGRTDQRGGHEGDDNLAITNCFFVQWGNTNYMDSVESDECRSAIPSTAPFVLEAYRANGRWLPDVPAWNADGDPNRSCSLNIDFDRTLLGKTLREEKNAGLFYRVSFYDYTQGGLFVDLVSSNGLTILTNIAGNLYQGSSDIVTVALRLPIERPDAAGASCVNLRAEGMATVLDSALYIADANILGGSDIARYSWGVYGKDPSGNGTNGSGNTSTNLPGPYSPTNNPSSTNSPPTPQHRRILLHRVKKVLFL